MDINFLIEKNQLLRAEIKSLRAQLASAQAEKAELAELIASGHALIQSQKATIAHLETMFKR
jgi:regulator of replication initiation timing